MKVKRIISEGDYLHEDLRGDYLREKMKI